MLGPAATVSVALALLDSAVPDVCVLDVNLRGQHSTPVADRLRTMKIPFVLSSAYGSQTLDQYDSFQGISNVGKPAPPHLPSVLVGLAGSRRG